VSEGQKHSRWLALAASSAVLAGSLAWALFSGGASGGDGSMKLNSNREGGLVPVDELSRSLVEQQSEWGDPAPQGGPNWVFDLFTPPVIYYDEASGSFTVTPPGSRVAPVDDFPMVLKSVKRPAYRYQLIAYAGTSGQYLLTLEDRVAGKDVFVAPGETIPGSDVLVKSFEEKRIVPEGLAPGTTEVFDLVGVCQLEDPSRGGDVSLMSGKVFYLDESRAMLHADDPIADWELSTGELFEYAGKKFRIQSIDPDLCRVSIQLISDEGEVLRERSLQLDDQEEAPEFPTIHSN